MTSTRWLVLAAGLVAAGVLLFLLKPDGPEARCATDPNVTSGFIDEEKNCPISIESYNEIRESRTGPQWFNIGALLLVLGGAGTGVAGLVQTRRQRDVT